MLILIVADAPQGQYDFNVLHNQVVAFPISCKAYQNSLKVIIDICKSIHGWLGLNPRNVAVIHCINGIQKTVTAICSYLVYSQVFTNFQEATSYFRMRKCIPESIQLPVAQLRYLEYFDTVIALNGMVPNPYPLAISRIQINGIPSFTSNEWTPGIEIYANGTLILSTIPKRQYLHPVSQTHSKRRMIFNLDRALILERDIQFRLFRHLRTADANEIWTILSFSFNTAYMPTEGTVRVALKDFEISKRANGDSPIFPKDFSIDFEVGVTKALQNQLSYNELLTHSLSKCITRLARYHSVIADQNLVSKLGEIGYPRFLAHLSASMSQNDFTQASEICQDIIERHPTLWPNPIRRDNPKSSRAPQVKRDSKVSAASSNNIPTRNSMYSPEGTPRGIAESLAARAATSADRLASLLNRPVKPRTNYSNNQSSDFDPSAQSKSNEEAIVDRLGKLLKSRTESADSEEILKGLKSHFDRRSSSIERKPIGSSFRGSLAELEVDNSPLKTSSIDVDQKMLQVQDTPIAFVIPSPPIQPDPGPKPRNKLHWEEIRTNVVGSVWEDSAEADANVKLDVQKFEEIFCAKPQNTAFKLNQSYTTSNQGQISLLLLISDGLIISVSDSQNLLVRG